ncbi:MAG TPA: hypothetical protein VEQ10_20025 [Vicinamibacteria bacterium]|nr:hypothetical protein [Vicinamibacteria bacterium]
MSRLSTTGTCVALLFLVAGCSNSSSPTATPTVAPSVTDTFTGTLAQGGSAAYNFTLASDGTITVTLTSLSPQSTITMGIGLGTPGTTGCVVSSTQENVKVGVPIQASLTAGPYCLTFYDLGNMTGTNTYTLTILHP